MGINKFKKKLVVNVIPKPAEGNFEFEWEYIYLANSDEKVNIFSNKNGKYIPQAKDRLFFYPDCNVPRYKVREWCNKNNASVTIKEENATVKFCTEKVLEQYIDNTNFSVVSTDLFLKWIEDNCDKSKGNSVQLVNEINNINQEEILFSRNYSESAIHALIYSFYGSKYQEYGYKHDFNKYSTKDTIISTYEYYMKISDEDYLTLNNLAQDKTVYNQDQILALITSTSTLINSEMYNTLRTMFQSSNTSDQVLALEIVANCNIQASLHHVMLLLKEFNGVICNLKESNHINFKSLLEFIGFEKRDLYRIDEDVIVKCLMDKYLLTMPILKECAEAVKNQWIRERGSKFFKVETITVTDEVKNYFSNLAKYKPVNQTLLVTDDQDN